MDISSDLVTRKASGSDHLPPVLHKSCAKRKNLSVSQIKRTGNFPNCWKKSIVSPTHKKDSKSDVENYRQFSLLPITSKVFERCLFIYLYRHLKPIFHDSQYGFRKRRSCVIELLVFLDIVSIP